MLIPLTLASAIVALAQGGALTAPIDFGALLLKGLLALVAVLLTTVTFFVKRLIGSHDGFKEFVREDLATVKNDVNEVKGEIRSVKQELFGVSGQNGMRSEQREQRQTIELVQRSVNELAASVQRERMEDQ